MTAKADITSRSVEVEDHHLHVNFSGPPDAPAVLFLHGSGPGATALSNWEGVLRELGTDYFCVAPDVLGFSDSTHPSPSPQGIGPFTERRISSIVRLLDVLGLEKVTITGTEPGDSPPRSTATTLTDV